MLVGQWRSLDDNDVYIMAQAREQGHCHERVDYLSSWMSLTLGLMTHFKIKSSNGNHMVTGYSPVKDTGNTAVWAQEHCIRHMGHQQLATAVVAETVIESGSLGSPSSSPIIASFGAVY